MSSNSKAYSALRDEAEYASLFRPASLRIVKEPALIVIDLLNDFLQSWASETRERLIRSTNASRRM
jgi:hypothetical protein